MKKGLKVLVKLFKTILKAFKRLLNAIIKYNQKACLQFFEKFSFTRRGFVKVQVYVSLCAGWGYFLLFLNFFTASIKMSSTLI